MRLKIAQIQMKVTGNQVEDLRHMRELVHTASRKSEFVFLPEMFCSVYDSKLFYKYKVVEGDHIYTLLEECAREEGIYLSAGSVPEYEDGKLYNTAYVFNPQGKCIAKHRKVHLFDIDIPGKQRFMESETLCKGNDITVFGSEYGKMGLCICFDVRFPEIGRLTALKGAKVMVVPASFNTTTGPAGWELCMRAQAMFNQIYVIATSTALNPDASYHSYGHSLVVDPWGQVINTLDYDEDILYTDIDLTLVEEVREQLPLLKHRRDDIYTIKEK